MGFHKRYIDDDQVIDIYREQGKQGVMDWYTRGVDAIITSGDLSEGVHDIIYSENVVEEEKLDVISMMIGIASAKKIRYEKEKTVTSS
jgi:hypothetical protein|tara:strand:+ start:127 stop:390 length:264 start_codon:yes stop_codon:yes gene_type:complete